ncbi:MAG: RNA polymerase sigma factor [Blastocatellia bacterium]|nr:RNA polymerase sigma factor [Blastocatellia bacterium]
MEQISQSSRYDTNTIIERAQRGDAVAFEQLLLAHQQRVMATAWRMLGNVEDARDAAQEVFLRLYKHLPKYDAQQEFAGWLYRIVINVCHDVARKRGNRYLSFEAEQEAGKLPILASCDDSERAAIQAEEQAIVMRALSTLSEKERAAIVLRDLEGISTEEVARILGSSATTVRSQISAARTKIKQYRDRFLKGGHR